MEGTFFTSAKDLISLRGTLNNIHLHPGYYQRHTEWLAASDLGFFSYNASLRADRSGVDAFHEAFSKFRLGTTDRALRYVLQLRMRRAIFDQAAALDMATGGTTLVVHMPGAQEPGTPALPEYLKAFVYVPSPVLEEIESQGWENPVPDIIQYLIRELHVPTVKRFQRTRGQTWNLPPVTHGLRIHPLPEIFGMPTAIPEGSSRYIFYGQKTRDTPDLASYFSLPSGGFNVSIAGSAFGTATIDSEDLD